MHPPEAGCPFLFDRPKVWVDSEAEHALGATTTLAIFAKIRHKIPDETPHHSGPGG
jgi:hypothetical protein